MRSRAPRRHRGARVGVRDHLVGAVRDVDGGRRLGLRRGDGARLCIGAARAGLRAVAAFRGLPRPSLPSRRQTTARRRMPLRRPVSRRPLRAARAHLRGERALGRDLWCVPPSRRRRRADGQHGARSQRVRLPPRRPAIAQHLLSARRRRRALRRRRLDRQLLRFRASLPRAGHRVHVRSFGEPAAMPRHWGADRAALRHRRRRGLWPRSPVPTKHALRERPMRAGPRLRRRMPGPRPVR